eukprot:tig00000411_g531.t1
MSLRSRASAADLRGRGARARRPALDKDGYTASLDEAPADRVLRPACRPVPLPTRSRLRLPRLADTVQSPAPSPPAGPAGPTRPASPPPRACIRRLRALRAPRPAASAGRRPQGRRRAPRKPRSNPAPSPAPRGPRDA